MPVIRVSLSSLGTMPWGVHRNELLSDVPSDYLRWVLHRSDHADSDLKREVRAELDRRRAEQPGVMYVRRYGRSTVHLSIGGDPPLCGSFWSFRGNESLSAVWPGGKACQKGCFH
jgi:hypothetical protein